MKTTKRIRIDAAVRHFGRAGDGYGGRAELARALGITQAAIGRWAGPYLPPHHTETLLARPHRCRHLLARGNK